ncbi:rhomboid family intramembrane serine protease [Motiliproteus sediminis]|uniref:rhomboid family intramembrane serine protease n=1 Tax=Motiliproteus sediminis TaxID=1468178 RepID=UPI001AEF4A82|nr:rhomboid family intramembrane serine protease [Motiliproteus sediminis]
MHKLMELPASVDLRDFAAFLWRQQIPHRITHFDGQQQLWLGRESDVDFVTRQFERWRDGESLADEAVAVAPGRSSGLRLSIHFYPVTMALIGISLLVAVITGLGDNLNWLHWFTFVDFNFQGQQLLFQSLGTLIESGQWWRWVTPIFVHFSVLHLVFNLLWTWELGRRIEHLQKRRVLVVLVLFTGIVSNLAQYLMTGPLFGGLSGVIFGLMGYTWLWDRLNPERRFGLPPALMTFMMIWLVLGVSGAIEAMGMGSIANTAHLIGLLSGLLATPVVYLLRHRLWRRG